MTRQEALRQLQVLKKWQANDDKPYARWFCDVVTPIRIK